MIRNKIAYVLMAAIAVTIYYLGTQLTATRELATKAQERFELAMSSSGTGTWVWEISSIPETGAPYHGDDVVWYSPRIREMTGYTDLPNTRSAFFSILHPDDVPVVNAALRQYFDSRGLRPYVVEYRLRHNDGSYHWYEAKGSADFEPNGNVRHMAGFITAIDSTKGDRVLLARVLDMLDTAVIICDEERRVLYFNQMAERLTGYKAEEAMGKHVEDLVVPHNKSEEHIKKYSQAARAISINGVADLHKPTIRGEMLKKDGSTCKILLKLAGVQYGNRYAFAASIMPDSQVTGEASGSLP